VEETSGRSNNETPLSTGDPALRSRVRKSWNIQKKLETYKNHGYDSVDEENKQGEGLAYLQSRWQLWIELTCMSEQPETMSMT
jgi:hypothetical protein